MSFIPHSERHKNEIQKPNGGIAVFFPINYLPQITNNKLISTLNVTQTGGLKNTTILHKTSCHMATSTQFF